MAIDKHLERISAVAAAALKAAVRDERKRCAGLALEAMRERQLSGDPEGEGVLEDLWRAIKDGPSDA